MSYPPVVFFTFIVFIFKLFEIISFSLKKRNQTFAILKANFKKSTITEKEYKFQNGNFLGNRTEVSSGAVCTCLIILTKV